MVTEPSFKAKHESPKCAKASFILYKQMRLVLSSKIDQYPRAN